MRSLLSNIIDLSSFNEAVVVLGGKSTHTTPLGIYYDRRKNLLAARIYPGTHLHQNHSLYTEACIAFPLHPEPYYEAVLYKRVTVLSRALTLHTPCPGYACSVKIEAVIKSRERRQPFIILYFDSIHVEKHDKPIPYRRSLGCSVELLIAYTRLRYWSHVRPVDCSIVEKLVTTACRAFDCILHSTWNERVHHYAYTTLSKALNYAISTGCISESKLEKLC